MKRHFNLQSLICVCLVVAVHIVIIAMMWPKNNLSTTLPSEQRYLQYVSVIVPPSKLPVPSAKKVQALAPKMSKVNKRDLVISHAPVIFPISESETALTNSPPQNEPKLDLNALRASAVQYELGKNRSPKESQQEMQQKKQTLEAKLERAASKAQHTDCRTRYVASGLLSPLFIAADLLSEKGCQF